MTSTTTDTATAKPAIWLTQQEVILLIMLGIIGALAISVVTLLDRQVAWPVFFRVVVINFALMAFGAAIRAFRNMERMGLAMIAVSFYMSFGIFMLILSNSFFPVVGPIIDTQLIEIDAMLGFHWAGFVGWLAEYPTLGKLLGPIYTSSLIQLAILFGVLAWYNSAQQIYHLVACGTVGLALTMAIWIAIPSFGPSAYQPISPDVANAINLFTDNAYGATLLDYAKNGIPIISPETVKATVAFPSFHIIMACLTVWFARGTMVFWPVAILNTLMIPATLSHGGHHLIDLIAGVVVFFVALRISAWLLKEPNIAQA